MANTIKNYVNISFSVFLILATAGAQEKKEDKVTFAEHILPIFENHCLNCHNPDEAKGGLDLSTYGATLTGGSGGKVVIAEDPSGSRVYSLMAHTAEPFMPPRKPKTPDAELAVIAKWINGGLLETATSKAKKSDKPKMDLSLVSPAGKPEGPAAMPEHVILQPEIVTERPNAVPALAHSPWAPIIAIAGQKQVILYNSQDFEVLGILAYPEGFPQSLSFSSNGSILQAGGGRGGKSGNVVAWDVKTGERVFEVGKEFDIVLGSDITPDHRHVVMGGPGKIFKIWDTIKGEQVAAVKKHPDWMLTADFSPDGVLLATGGRNGSLFVWEAITGLEFYTLKGHTLTVTDLAWRPDSNILGSISEDGQVILWEMNEGQQFKKWAAHGGGGLAIDFSADGSMIATAGRDKTVKLWKSDGTAIRSINASDDIVMSIAFTSDNKRVISGDYNGVIKVWDVTEGKELATLDANPPTIDHQIAYAEKRISEINAKNPALEKTAATVSNDATKAKTLQAELTKKIAESDTQQATLTKDLAALDAMIKTLNDEKTKFQGLVTQNTAVMQQRTVERVNAEKELVNLKKELTLANDNLLKTNKLLKESADTLNATKKLSESQEFPDPARQKAYLAAKAAYDSATNAKNAVNLRLSDLQTQINTANAKLAEAKKPLAAALATLEKAKAAREQAQNLVKTTAANVILTGDKLASGTNKAELTVIHDQAKAENSKTQEALKKANDAFTLAQNSLNSIQGNVSKEEATSKAIAAQLLTAQNDQKAKLAAYQTAESTFKPFLNEASVNSKAIIAAKAELPVKIESYKKVDAEQKRQQDLYNQINGKLTQADAKLKATIAAENSVKSAMDEANKSLAAKAKQQSETTAKLNTAKADLEKVKQALDSTKKQKEAHDKSLATIAAQESEAKKSIEVVKADLQQSQYLAQKFKAAAINYEAKIETNELGGMAADLEGMLTEETEAKGEFQAATAARISAEKALKDAENTVTTGNQKLKETTVSVLDRALALIASRASAELRQEIGTESINVAANEKADTVVDPEETIKVVEVVSNTLANKTSDEINAEIAVLQKRLEELSHSIKEAYTEAEKTKTVVVQASDVAAKTPAVIAERSQIEANKAKAALEIEQQRKAQEATVAKQKELIDELKKRYLETVPTKK